VRLAKTVRAQVNIAGTDKTRTALTEAEADLQTRAQSARLLHRNVKQG